MRAIGGIRMEEITACLLCGKEGAELYGSLSDHLFGVPGEWGFLQCTECGLAWLNPRPIAADLHQTYRTYYTHVKNGKPSLLGDVRERAKRALYATTPGYSGLGNGWIWRQIGRALTRLPAMRERALLGTMCLDGGRKGTLLDVGCGNGRFLLLMREAGWEVRGVEPDPVAAKIAQEENGIPVTVGALDDAELPDESFDAITLNHVIEHVHDPVALLSQCRRVLKPKGTAVIVTPNIESLGHETFGCCWRGLEPPRHLHLFSLRALRACCERAGMRIQVLRTSARSARGIRRASEAIKRRAKLSSFDPRFRGMLSKVHHVVLGAPEKAEEEILAVTGRPSPRAGQL
jgi:2-polyprenyl-3-methyl-5-hydroxy-6-metoxy-1,4-benzoquinol methylase